MEKRFFKPVFESKTVPLLLTYILNTEYLWFYKAKIRWADGHVIHRSFYGKHRSVAPHFMNENVNKSLALYLRGVKAENYFHEIEFAITDLKTIAAVSIITLKVRISWAPVKYLLFSLSQLLRIIQVHISHMKEWSRPPQILIYWKFKQLENWVYFAFCLWKCLSYNAIDNYITIKTLLHFVNILYLSSNLNLCQY